MVAVEGMTALAEVADTGAVVGLKLLIGFCPVGADGPVPLGPAAANVTLVPASMGTIGQVAVAPVAF